jgi:anaerobic selenocysteine-containing dehydrogenase
MANSKGAVTVNEEVTHGICYMCTHKCPTKIHVRDGKAVSIEIADERVDFCPRWKAQLDYIYHPDRLKYPVKRAGERGNDNFVRISWEEALDTVASRLQKVKDEYGPESVVFYIAYTKEPRPYFHRLTHAFGSPNYCTESSNCFSATWLATFLNYGRDYGYWAMQSKQINPATRMKIIWGSSVINSFPQGWKELVEARTKGMKLVVVDPIRTKIASMADIHLQLRPGTDGALALGIMNVIINAGVHDKEFLEKWTVGFEDLKKMVQEYTPEKVEKITWVPAEKVKEAAMLYAGSKPAQVEFSTNSTIQHSNGLQGHRAITLLPAITGNFEVLGGNRWRPDMIKMNDIRLHKETIESLPQGLGADRFPIWTKYYCEMQSNLIADRIENPEPYPIKALFGAGLNLTFFPDSNRFVEMAKNLDFIAVNEYFLTPTAMLADIVLPIASWIERPILVTRPGGGTTYIQPAIEPVGESQHEFKIYYELARRWGFGDSFWNGDFEKSVSYILEPSGLTLEELKQNPQGMNYPVPPRPEKNYEKVPLQTPSGKVEIASSVMKEHGYKPLPVYTEPEESPLSRPDLAASFPLVLTTGARSLAYTHSCFRNIEQLRKLMPDPLIDINPADAAQRGIKDGDMVEVSSPRGAIKVKANITDTILKGVVHILHLWYGDGNVNILASDKYLDPVSGFAPFKAQLCQVMKL